MANKKNVEILWNGEPTLFLVNIPDNKRIINAVQQKPMPGILVPISAPISSPITATLSGPPPPPPPLPPNDLTLNRITVSQPQSSPPPLQPQTIDKTLPQYEEAAKQLAANNKVGKNHIKSQVMTDVLEILIKNGELPETAVFDPATPTTPGTNINLTPGLIYQPAKLTLNSGPPKLTMLRGVPANSNIENVEMLSPMQPDCENSVSSFDLFMERQQQEKRDQQGAKPELIPLQQNNDVPNLHPASNGPPATEQSNQIVSNGHQSDIKHFDDLELMDIIGMDIGDEQYQSNTVKNSLINGNASGLMSKAHRRDMNPSLQPSLNELIMEQQQQQQQSTSYNNNFNFDGCNSTNNNTNNNNNNNTFHSIPMDIEDFENSLSHFDFSSIGVADEQINTPPHPFSQLQHQNQQQSIGNNSVVDVDAHDPNLSINNDNYLDFFNIDDFKMGSDNTLSFGEVDFPV